PQQTGCDVYARVLCECHERRSKRTDSRTLGAGAPETVERTARADRWRRVSRSLRLLGISARAGCATIRADRVSRRRVLRAHRRVGRPVSLCVWMARAPNTGTAGCERSSACRCSGQGPRRLSGDRAGKNKRGGTRAHEDAIHARACRPPGGAMNRPRWTPVLTLCVLVIVPGTARAHESRPASLEIVRTPNGTIVVVWKRPMQGEGALHLIPRLSSGWLDREPDDLYAATDYLIATWRIPQQPIRLEGQTVGIEGLTGTITDAIVRVRFADGNTEDAVLRGGIP